MLTIIIPFLNEGVEVYNTVKNIRDTANIDLNIILINDASTNGYDYESVSKNFNAEYIVHTERRGVAASRDEGVSICNTEYFMLLDAHMRFFQTDWAHIIIGELKKNDRTLFYCQTISLSVDDNSNVVVNKKQSITYGVYQHNDETNPYLSKWNYYDPDPNKSIVDIACVLGASYSTNKTYWQYLRGLNGLRSYGRDEELISLKVWLEGGSCKLIKDISMGHVYRPCMPYDFFPTGMVYNILCISELFSDKGSKLEVLEKLEQMHTDNFNNAKRLLSENKNNISEQKEYYKKIFKREIGSILRQNNLLQDINKIYKQYNPLSRFTINPKIINDL